MINLYILSFAVIVAACQSDGKETQGLIIDTKTINADSQIHLFYKDFKAGDWAFSKEEKVWVAMKGAYFSFGSFLTVSLISKRAESGFPRSPGLKALPT